MLKSLVSLAVLVSASDAVAASSPTDFGVRTVPGELSIEPVSSASAPSSVVRSAVRSSVNLASVAGIGSRWGRVTSTYRTRARNRAVGGVRNSYHLSGRAIDIARRPGVTHGQIAAAYRNAGYHLIESLDEGDHSHFAFGSAPRIFQQAGRAQPAGGSQQAGASTSAQTRWRIVSAANAALK